MSDSDKKRYYWLKLDKNFFKRHDVRIIENLPNGKDYIIFYLKLLCESTSHDGRLRFSDEIPYDNQMLSIITNTSIDVVKNAIEVFNKLKMIEILDDGTLYMRQIEKMVGSETGKAQRMRDYRERLNNNENLSELTNATSVPQCSLEKELDIEKDIDIEIEKEKEKDNNNFIFTNDNLSDEPDSNDEEFLKWIKN